MDTLRVLGHEVVDFGAYCLAPEDDYPDFVLLLAQAVGSGEVERGIAVCGSGVAACVAANKVPRVRAALITDVYSAHQGAEHDDMNVICLGARVIGCELSSGLDPCFPGCPIHRGRATPTSPGESRGDGEQRDDSREQHPIASGRKAENMTIQIDGKMTVRDLVGRYPQTRPVFEKLRIDYCCGGSKCLADVANEHGLKLPALVDALEKTLRAESGKAEATGKDWYAAPLGELVSHIVETHHGYMKTALPRLRSLAPTVLKAHEANHGEVLRQVQDLFKALDAELSSHLMKEELQRMEADLHQHIHLENNILFPRAIELEERPGENGYGTR